MPTLIMIIRGIASLPFCFMLNSTLVNMVAFHKCFDFDCKTPSLSFDMQMTAPEAGGATVFPELKLSVFPTQRDAVFWYNLYKNGEGDMRTRHAACPVLSGQKWVANRWIHERGQEHTRKCGKTYEEREVRVADEELSHFPFE